MHVSESPAAFIGFSLYVCNFVDVCGPRKLITNEVSFYVTSSSVSFHMRCSEKNASVIIPCWLVCYDVDWTSLFGTYHYR